MAEIPLPRRLDEAVIGVIGPADSTALAVAVAAEEGLADQVVGRAYGSVEEALGLAVELDRVCQVLLFTGRVPYALARASEELAAALRYVPHSGADLYRTLVHLLREFRGELPRISLDTIQPSIVREAYLDLGLDPPQHILPLEMDGDLDRIRPTADIITFHLARAQAGDVDVCVTCLGEVDRELRAAGVRTWRIAHTRAVLRDALYQAELTARLAITETTQPAAVLVQLPGVAEGVAAGTPGSYETQRRRLRARETVLDLAERLQGRLAELDEATFIVHTNRGTAEGAVTRLMAGHGGPLDATGLPAELRVGIGMGATVPGAEENARKALVMGERDGDLHVAYPDGSVVRASRDRPAETFRLRATDGPTLRIARELGLGPLALTRLTQALRQVDASAVTAAELAQAYGIEARSARRLMTALGRAGIATRLGRQGGPRAGRPQTVYRIDVSRLIPADGE